MDKDILTKRIHANLEHRDTEEDIIEHYGVKGQKWGVRRASKLNAKAQKINRKNSAESDAQYEKATKVLEKKYSARRAKKAEKILNRIDAVSTKKELKANNKVIKAANILKRTEDKSYEAYNKIGDKMKAGKKLSKGQRKMRDNADDFLYDTEVHRARNQATAMMVGDSIRQRQQSRKQLANDTAKKYNNPEIAEALKRSLDIYGQRRVNKYNKPFH